MLAAWAAAVGPTFTLALLSLLAPASATTTPPLVIVPGLGGSVLEAKLHDRPKYRDCSTESDWYTIWASLVQGIARYDCFVQDLSLVPDPSGGPGVANFTGVEIRPRDFGGTGGIEYSNAGTSEPPIAYMHALVQRLEAAGYVAGKTVRAATNDFRSAGVPEALDYQYALLRNLVEATSRMNGGQKVHLLSHSLGGPYANLFLTTFVSATWKRKYVASHIALSAPLLGTPVAIEGVLSGPMYDYVPQFLPQLVVPVIRTCPSIIWMFPSNLNGLRVWGGPDNVFVRTPSTNYTMDRFQDLLKAVNATVLDAQWERMNARIAKSADDPGVPVLCIYANDTKTDMAISLPDDHFDKKGEVVSWKWGDGTVPTVSLQACARWQDATVKQIQFGGSLAAHTEIVQNKEVIDDIIAWLTANGKKESTR